MDEQALHLRIRLTEDGKNVEFISWDDPCTDYVRLTIDEETCRFKYISYSDEDFFIEVEYNESGEYDEPKTLEKIERLYAERNRKKQHNKDCQCEACKRKRGE